MLSKYCYTANIFLADMYNPDNTSNSIENIEFITQIKTIYN